jgi:hypothetical protein
MKNQLIIFSKNRACQLHLLLESIEKNSNQIFDVIKVIYTFTTEDFFNGYKILKEKFPNVIFILENDFHQTTINSIDPSFEYTTFMVDDNVFYNKLNFSKSEILSPFDDIKKPIICFSLRLGLNCNFSHPANLFYEINGYEEVNNFITVDVRNQKVDFGYPLSVDGHIFKTTFIEESFSLIGEFTNPNYLESKLQFLMGMINKNMTFFKESVLVGIPVNIVNDTHMNRQGLKFYFSETYLNDRYVNGEIIDLDSLDFSDINGPHKEIEYKFK